MTTLSSVRRDGNAHSHGGLTHAHELAGLADQLQTAGKLRAYRQVMEAVTNFGMGNALLDAVRKELSLDIL